MFRKKKPRLVVNEFTIFGVFVGVALIGIVFGLLAYSNAGIDFTVGDATDMVVPPPAPTADQYQSDVRDVLTPLFAEASRMTDTDLSGDTSSLADLVGKTEERLLRERVPKEYRDFHLSTVLLLDQWKRALAGSAPDRAVVLDKTRAQIAANPWLGL